MLEVKIQVVWLNIFLTITKGYLMLISLGLQSQWNSCYVGLKIKYLNHMFRQHRNTCPLDIGHLKVLEIKHMLNPPDIEWNENT